jgi:hypothetical protein
MLKQLLYLELNVVVKYSGRVHDSFIWNNCGLKLYFNNNNINGWLLGDSGYPLEKNLMTPFLNPQNNGQMRYNVSHITTRNVIERAFGVLKMRFRCLDRTAGKLMLSPERSCNVIISCFILHNISRKYNFFGSQTNELEVNDNIEIENSLVDNIEARDLRNSLVTQSFINE